MGALPSAGTATTSPHTRARARQERSHKACAERRARPAGGVSKTCTRNDPAKPPRGQKRRGNDTQTTHGLRGAARGRTAHTEPARQYQICTRHDDF